MTLNGVMAVTLPYLIASEWLKLDRYCLLQKFSPKNPAFGSV